MIDSTIVKPRSRGAAKRHTRRSERSARDSFITTDIDTNNGVLEPVRLLAGGSVAGLGHQPVDVEDGVDLAQLADRPLEQAGVGELDLVSKDGDAVPPRR